MAYQALYRVYRPKTFGDIIGQEHITAILKSQVETGRISHAYLFCGVRGTGKTSTARVFARAMNCVSEGEQPCNACAACVSDLTDASVDIIEIDAASNNGVDEIRDIRDKVQFSPVNSRYKVYIIDEVHMLSSGAFNALLKTLEEPPAHAVFLLATTEPRKLPATVLSRCQRYEFRRISDQLLFERLAAICAEQGAEYQDDALRLICRCSEGGLRDAISLLDQCIALNGANVTYTNALDVLGTADNAFFFALVDAVISNEAGQALTLLDGAFQNGRDVMALLRDLTAHFRALMICSAVNDAGSLLQVSDDDARRYAGQAERVSRDKVFQAIRGLTAAERDIRRTLQPRYLLEAAVLELLDNAESGERKAETPPSPYQEKKQSVLRPSAPEQPEPQMETVVVDAPPWEDVPMEAEAAAKPPEPIYSAADNLQASEGERSHTMNEADYRQLTDSIRREDKALYTLVSEGKFAGVDGNVLTIAFPENARLFVTALQKEKNVNAFRGILDKKGYTGLRPEFVIGAPPPPLPEAASQNKNAGENHITAVDQIKSLFDGENIRIIE